MRFGGKNLCPSDHLSVLQVSHLLLHPPFPGNDDIGAPKTRFPVRILKFLINQGEKFPLPLSSQKIPLLDFNAFMNVHLLSLAQIHRAGAFKKRHLILPGKLPLPWVCWGDVLVLSFGHIASHHVRGHSVGWRVPTGQSSTRWAWKP